MKRALREALRRGPLVRGWIAVGAFAVLALAPLGRAAVPGPGPIDLGTLPNGEQSAATAINAAGRVVGHSTTAVAGFPVTHAFFWSLAAGIKDLGTLLPAG